MDSDGYPDKNELDTIRKWECTDFDGLMEYVQPLWSYPDRFYKEKQLDRITNKQKDRWYLSTGGWSGNENLIGAMQDNTMWWMLFWYQSRVGGHYWFEGREFADSKKGE